MLPDGTVQSDGTGRQLAAIRPGTRIVAVTDRQGRVTVLSAVTRLPGSKPKQRAAAAPSRVLSRSRVDPYAIDPREVMHSGHAGRIIDIR